MLEIGAINLKKVFGAFRHSARRITANDIGEPERHELVFRVETDPSGSYTGLPDYLEQQLAELQWSNSDETAPPGSMIWRKPQKIVHISVQRQSNLKPSAPNREHDKNALEALSEPGEPKSKYTFYGMIANGAYGTVYYGQTRGDGRRVAIKECRADYMQESPTLYLNELIALKVCQQHPNVVSLIASHMAYPIDNENTAGAVRHRTNVARVPFLVMELMEMSLYDMLTLVYRDRCLSEALARYVMREMLVGMAYLHRKGIVHRDMKSDNVLLSRNGDVKIADLGLSCRFAYREQKFKKEAGPVGTVLWMAPEMIVDQTYTFLADIWSLGITFIELFDGLPPYIGELERNGDKGAVLEMIVSNPPTQPKRPVSCELQEVFRATLRRRPERRLSCSSILALPALQNTSTADVFASYLNSLLATEEY